MVGRYLRLAIDGVDHRLYFEETGPKDGSGIPLVCLHTAGADGRQFRHLLADPEITSRFRVLAFDMPWHGKSTPPDGWEKTEYRLTTASYTAAIRAFCQAMELDRPVVMGCSIGGRIVLHLALDHPERFRAIIGLQAGAQTDHLCFDFYDLPQIPHRIGEELGLPHQMIYRHPFPGPGLGVRILGEVKKEYADLLRKADAIYLEELYRHNLYDKISQAFAVFLPVKSVAVLGDARAYDYVIALRAVEAGDFMTANWAQIPYEVLGIISNRIINEVKGVNRVVYDVSSKPPATMPDW